MALNDEENKEEWYCYYYYYYEYNAFYFKTKTKKKSKVKSWIYIENYINEQEIILQLIILNFNNIKKNKYIII